MKLIHKATSAVLALSFLIACNFCAVQCAFASEPYESAAQCHESADHHQESQDSRQHSESEKHDAGSTCCSSLIAVKNSSTDAFFSKVSINPVFLAAPLENQAYVPNVHSKDKSEFPPGTSPPSAFLLAHFTHAPPTSF
jgi:hypothetical protein